MIEFFDSNPQVFYGLWFGTLVFVLVVFFIGGRKAEQKFEGLEGQTVRFRERGASGRSHKSLATKFGGASRVLDVIVTDRELWIKGIWPAFTFIGTRFDLTHRVPLETVGSARVDRRRVLFSIRGPLGTESTIELQVRDPNGFIRALRA